MNNRLKTARIGTALVILSVLALLVAPVLMEHQSRTLRESIVRVGEPARLSTSRIQLALAIQVASLRGFIISGSASMLDEYRAARAAELAASHEIVQHAAQLGDGVDMAAKWTSKASEAWNAQSERLAAGHLAKEEFVAALGQQQQLYRAALHACARLEEAISRFQNNKRSAIQRLERIRVMVLIGLTVLATASAGMAVYMSSSVRVLSAVATSDPLTGLLNRRGFVDTAKRVLRRPGALPATLIYIDVDDFKSINDTHGHARGDEVLKRVAQSARSAIRPVDLAARLGGDEFVLLLRNQDERGAPEAVVERLAAQVRRDLAQSEQAVTLSIGAVTSREERRLATLLEAADSTMYDVKRQGKGSMIWRELGADP